MTTTLTPSRPWLRLSDLTLLLVNLVWGTSHGVAKGALDFYPVLGFLAVRFGLTFVLLLPAVLRAPRGQQRDAMMLMAAALRAITVCKTSQLTRHSSASALALTAVQAG